MRWAVLIIAALVGGTIGWLMNRSERRARERAAKPMCQHIFCIKHASGRLNGRDLCGEHWKEEVLRSGIKH